MRDDATTRLDKVVRRLASALGVGLRLGGTRYKLHPFHRDQLSWHPYHERWLDPVLDAALSCTDEAFVDVGVNTGQTLLKLLDRSPARQYLGFEPQLDCCFFVQRFIQQNDLRNCSILPIGLGNSESIARLYMRSAEIDDTASIVEGFRPDDFYSSSQYVTVAVGDRVLEELNFGPVGILKIDVEGGELEVLQGLSRTLEVDRPFILFEVLRNFLVVTRQKLSEPERQFRIERTKQLEAILRDRDYSLFRVKFNGAVERITEIDVVNFREGMSNDYVAVPGVRPDDFLSALNPA